jgi:hypothetical protein
MARSMNSTLLGDVILSNINLQTYRKLASPSSGVNMEAEVSLKLLEISTGLHVAMSEDTFFKFPGNFSSNLRIPVVSKFPIEHTPSVITYEEKKKKTNFAWPFHSFFAFCLRVFIRE